MSHDKKVKAFQENQIDCREIILSEDYIDLISPYLGNVSTLISQYKAPCHQLIDDSYVVLHTHIEDFEQLELNIEIIPKLLGPYGSYSLERSGILVLHTHPYIPLTGKGVLIGFVDSGIDYTHPAFVNEDNTSKIASIWDQTINTGVLPINFRYGSEYTQEDINKALNSDNPYAIVPSIDETGHGTFLAGVAAGRYIDDGPFVGAAPEAEIIMVKTKPAKKVIREFYLIKEDAIVYQDNDIIMGIQYLMQQASLLEKPLVICLGIGTNQGSHDGSSILETYIDRIGTTFGYTVVVPSGNEAYLGHHSKGMYLEGEPFQDVEIYSGQNERGFTVEIWPKSPDYFSVGILSPTGEYVDQIPPWRGRTREYYFWLERSRVEIDYLTLEARTGDQLIVIRFIEPTEGLWTIRLFSEIVILGNYNIWIDRKGWINPDTRFLSPSAESTVTVPGTARAAITVGAYDPYDSSLYINSGRGPTRDGTLKPEIVAPGVNVMGPIVNGDLGVMTGTSVASAQVAGAAALLLEWGIVIGYNPKMNTKTVKNLLIRGANRRDPFGYPNNQWGYGSLNLENAFKILRGGRR
ncbi:subtilase family protein [Natranaerovirga hydrolytica]|uniref:Subtilase family protein n=1 Tax=Natranaerovirga hydrolytica TaxID=680378 RepID=A0A4R1MYS0_9FIRM|nr:S8 family peptidase [Natranaerovirga hydrolytica]TCK98457.1 subtilase family protein [Natranaerovirga hydrolytica]